MSSGFKKFNFTTCRGRRITRRRWRGDSNFDSFFLLKTFFAGGCWISNPRRTGDRAGRNSILLAILVSSWSFAAIVSRFDATTPRPRHIGSNFRVSQPARPIRKTTVFAAHAAHHRLQPDTHTGPTGLETWPLDVDGRWLGALASLGAVEKRISGSNYVERAGQKREVQVPCALNSLIWREARARVCACAIFVPISFRSP